MNEFEKEVKTDFLYEATQLLNDAEQAFLALEGDKNNVNLINEIFRLAHNLKGTSRAVGFGDVAEFTHEMENLILKIKEGLMAIDDNIVSLLLECNDHLVIMIKTLNQNLEARFDSKEIISKIQSALGGHYVAHAKEEIVVEKKPEPSSISKEVLSTLSAEDQEILRQFEAGLDAKPEVVTAPVAQESKEVKEKKEEKSADVIEFSKPAPVAAAPSAPASAPKEEKKAAPPSGGGNKSSDDENIRVSLARVEMLNNVVGELVIIQTVLNQHRDEVRNPLMLKSLSHLAKLSKEIQSISMSLRMVPIKQTLQKMQRIIRDTSKALNKKVNLELIGEETEIDKTVLEHLGDPLVHIVRNAVDHGLETTEARVMSGKDEEGNIAIKAYHEGNNLVIEISDDGKGINPKIIREKAIEKGVITASTQLSDDELVNLIFHPGFSTKTEVSEISGRGVGMDVVKTNIEKLSGEVRVYTEVGKGSTFKVVLPLTLAIIEGMVTMVGDERYIIPLAQIYESLAPSKDIIHYENGVGECLKIRGQVIPLFKVSQALNRPGDDKPINEQIAIIVNNADRSFGVIVDDILHQQQVVIKKLGDEIRNQKGFMGSSILGDGRPAFILDLVELFSGSMKKKKNTLFEDMAA